eukprot:7408721-Alexandrium_andersonii.AAC.1
MARLPDRPTGAQWAEGAGRRLSVAAGSRGPLAAQRGLGRGAHVAIRHAAKVLPDPRLGLGGERRGAPIGITDGDTGVIGRARLEHDGA